jgi:hypothetical protein
MRHWIGIGGILAAALTAVYFFYPQRLVLEIARADTGQVTLCADMAAEEEFVLSFVHSVNKRPVYDTLRVARDHLVIVKSRFDAFGAGMPETSTEQGTFRVAEDGWLEWTINRPLPEVIVRVGWVANHTLRLKGRETRLADLAEPGTPLAMRVRNRSIYAVWKGRCVR